MRQQDSNKTDERRTVQFVDGNTVKEIQETPQKRREEVHRELEEKKKRDKEELERKRKQDKEQRERKRKARATARKNQERALRMSPGYLLFVVAALALMAGVTVCYLQMRAELTRNTKRIASLESEVLTLKSNNDSKQQKLDASIDLEAIRQKAMEELGMVYPSEGQIEYFEVEDNDYMNQYGDIPKK